MVPAASDQRLRNSSQYPTLSAIKPEGRKAIHFKIGSATLHKDIELSFPLELS